MGLRKRRLFLAVALCGPAWPQALRVSHPWDAAFQQTGAAQQRGDYAEARRDAEQAWLQIRQAGPASEGYSNAVEQAYNSLINYAGTLPAENAYREALKATEVKPFEAVRVHLLLGLGDHLTTLRQEVKAESVFEQALALQVSGYALVKLAALKEELGKPAEAEKLYRRAMGQTISDPRMVPEIRFFSRPGPIMDWRDPELALAQFVARFGRNDEAEQIFQRRISAATATDKPSALRDYTSFLQTANRNSDVLARQQEIVALESADSSQAAQTRLAYDVQELARLEQAAGNSAQADGLMKAQVQKALDEHGAQSVEYRRALSSFGAQLMRSGNSEAAGKAIDEAVRVAAADPNTLQAALMQQANWKRASGDKKGADEIQERIGQMQMVNLHSNPSFEIDKLAAEAQVLVRNNQTEQANPLVDQAFSLAHADLGHPNPAAGHIGMLQNVAIAMGQKGHKQEALDIERRLLAWDEQTHGSDNPSLIQSLTNTASFCLSNLQMPEPAEELLDRATSLTVRMHGEQSTQMEEIERLRWDAAFTQHETEAASAAAGAMLKLAAGLHGAASMALSSGHQLLAFRLLARNRWSEAAPHFTEAIEISSRNNGYTAQHGELLYQAAQTFAGQRQFEEAASYNREAVVLAKALNSSSLMKRLLDQQLFIEKMRKQQGVTNAPGSSPWFIHDKP